MCEDAELAMYVMQNTREHWTAIPVISILILTSASDGLQRGHY